MIGFGELVLGVIWLVQKMMGGELMKERELRQHATCSMCRQKIGACGIPLFYRLTVERFVVKLDEVRRQTGLAMLLGGNGVIAQAMGTDEEMAAPVMEKLVLVVCESCSTGQTHFIAGLAEIESTVRG